MLPMLRAGARLRPLAELVPVGVLESGGDPRVGVRAVVDVVLEVSAEGNRLAWKIRQVHEHLAGQVCLRDRVVLEVEVGGDLEQGRPLGAGACAHGTSIRVDSFKTCSTRTARARANSGASFRDSMRSSSRPSSAAFSLASTSMSQRISRWSETNPTGATRTLRTPSE